MSRTRATSRAPLSLSDSRSGVTRVRPEILNLREELHEAREQFRDQHDRGAAAVGLCSRFTAVIDAAVTRLFEGAASDLPGLRAHCCLTPIGGYGRRQLAPYSDIDLMILHSGSKPSEVQELARRLTQDIFDSGLALGQSLRTPDEALALARHDAVTASSLIEARLLVGDSALYERFRTQFDSSLRRRARAFCAAFVDARREERLKFGETVYLLEPNIKRSRGALRDVHLLRWLWCAQTGVPDFDRLQAMGILSNFDYRRLTSARDFLMRVRNDLHLAAGAGRDDLSRAEQVRIAAKLGYRGRSGLLPVEQFMRDYFRHASHVWFLAARVSDLAAPKRTVSRVINTVVGRYLDHDYRVGLDDINATGLGRTKLQSRVEEVLRLVDLARVYQKRIGQDTWYLVYRAAPAYPTDLSPAAASRFLTILDQPEGLGDLLRRLHDLGVLEKVIPEFAHARCLLQFNQYHKYTVDEHCIRAVEEATRLATATGVPAEVYRGLPSKGLLHLTLLLHDLGKGHEEDHSVLGEAIAAQNGERLGLSEGDTNTVKFLVLKHLEMAHLAFRRDTSDPRTIEAFANEVGTAERLTLLFLVTCADMAAVGPGVMNAWKVDVLSDLYARTLEVLEPERAGAEIGRRRVARDSVWAELTPAERSDPWFARQFEALPESFVMSRPAEDSAAALRRLGRLSDGKGAAWGAPLRETGTLEFVAGVDRGTGRGVFSSMAGALSAARMQILAAETSQLDGGLLLLRYVVEDRGPGGEVDWLQRVAQRMVDSIDSDTPPKFLKIWGAEQEHSSARLANLPSEVRIDCAISPDYTIVEVFTFDRRGLLYDLARTLHDLGLVIRFAKIGTYLDQVVDVFYVTERTGAKPTDDHRLDEIRRRLRAVTEN